MPTVVAKCYNHILEEFYKRLFMKGKPSMVILTVGMRKLLHIIFGILKTLITYTYFSPKFACIKNCAVHQGQKQQKNTSRIRAFEKTILGSASMGEGGIVW